jgi:Fe-S-cluster containining protein
MLVGSPPFLSDEWASVRLRFPKNLRDEVDRSRANGSGGLRKTPATGEDPCMWLDLKTRKCMHYDLRPVVCRSFEIGEKDCCEHRQRVGIER